MNEVESKFEELSLSRKAEIIDSNQQIFRLTVSDSDEIRLAIAAIRTHFPKLKKIIVPHAYNIATEANTGNDYSNCEFLDEVSFEGSTFTQPTKFNNATFEKLVNFSEVTFKENVRFHKVHFKGRAKFTNTTFSKLIDFYFSEFHKDQQFHLTDFNETAIFSNVTFHERIQFLHNKVLSSSFISFENANFQKGLDLSRSNFWCTIQFWGATFSDDTIQESRISELYQTDNHESLEQVGETGALSRLRETFRIVKNNLISAGNHIEARNFHRLELSTYESELSLTKWNQRLDEKSLLWLNRISNNHGLSWWQGLKFTSGLTFIFYSIYLIIISSKLEFACTWSAFGVTLKHYVELINVTQWSFKPFGIDNEPWGFTFLFASRIFISYGYYQLIQSFRKFGKN